MTGVQSCALPICVIPFIFSPRVMFCNPQLLKESGLEVPSEEWTSDDFLHLLGRLSRKVSKERLLNYSAGAFFWMNFVFRSGGTLIDPFAENPVQIDSPETVRGIEQVRKLRNVLSAEKAAACDWKREFCEGRMPFVLAEQIGRASCRERV